MSMAIKYGLQKKAKKAEGTSACECEGVGCPMCKGGMMAEGGEVEGDSDLVARIMTSRKGGPKADEMPADFDVLDQMEVPDEANYTGANSGDDLGNETLDENDADLIRRIMRSRAKKDSLPRPA